MVVIERLETSDEGTFGRLLVGNLSLYTGELPWRENQTSVSCIPAGIYQCRWTYSSAFKRYMYVVEGVEGRTGIRKHSANFMGDRSKGFKAQLNGCISLGERVGWIEKQKALLLSAPAVRRFETQMELKPFTLEIRNGYL